MFPLTLTRHYNATSGLAFGTSWNSDADWNGSLDEVKVASWQGPHF